MTGYLLTDDEVLAAASQVGSPWPSVVPTVDLEDRAAVEAAVVRGARSLAVRGLLRPSAPGELEAELSPLVSKVLASRSVLGTYFSSAAAGGAPFGDAHVYYRDGDDCIAEVVSPQGVHRLSAEATSRCEQAVIEAIDQIFRAGVPSEARDVGLDAFYIVNRGGEGKDRTLVVASGSLEGHDGLGAREEGSSYTVFDSAAPALQHLGLDGPAAG